MSTQDNLDFKIEKNVSGDEEFKLYRNGALARRLPAARVAKLNEEITEWYLYLNGTVGFVSITFALAVQGTPHVYVNALISLIWILATHYWVYRNKFPKQLAFLENQTHEEYVFIRKKIFDKYLSFGALFRQTPLFLFGYLYLGVLAMCNFEPFAMLKVGSHTIEWYLLSKPTCS